MEEYYVQNKRTISIETAEYTEIEVEVVSARVTSLQWNGGGNYTTNLNYRFVMHSKLQTFQERALEFSWVVCPRNLFALDFEISEQQF